MVMGFKNGPQIMQRIMNEVFLELRGKGIMIYLDDIVVYSRTYEEHINLVNEVFKRLRKWKFSVNPEKAQLCLNKFKLLGVYVDGESQSPLEDQQKKLKKSEYLKMLVE